MTKNIILTKDNTESFSLNLAKTIFWVGAGVSADTPSNLPLGNDLTDAFLYAMIGEKSEDSGFYGDTQYEWNICMETPNLFDARMVIRAQMRQFWIMVRKLKIRNVRKYEELKIIYKKLDSMRADF